MEQQIEVLKRKRGRPPKQGDENDHRRHHSAVYFIVHELLCFFEEPHTAPEALVYLNERILPRIGSSKVERRALNKILRDLRGLALAGRGDDEDESKRAHKSMIRETQQGLFDAPELRDGEAVDEAWRAMIQIVDKRGKFPLYQRIATPLQSVPQRTVALDEAMDLIGRLVCRTHEEKLQMESLLDRLALTKSRLESQLQPELPLFNGRYWTVANAPFAQSQFEYAQGMPVLVDLLAAIKDERAVGIEGYDKEYGVRTEVFFPIKMAICEDSLYVLGVDERAMRSHGLSAPLQRRSVKRIEMVHALDFPFPEGYPTEAQMASARDFFKYHFGASLPYEGYDEPIRITVKPLEPWVKRYLLGLVHLEPVDVGNGVALCVYPSETIKCWLLGRKAMRQVDFDEGMVEAWV